MVLDKFSTLSGVPYKHPHAARRIVSPRGPGKCRAIYILNYIVLERPRLQRKNQSSNDPNESTEERDTSLALRIYKI